MSVIPEMKKKTEIKGLVLEQLYNNSGSTTTITTTTTTNSNQKQTLLVYKKYFLLCLSCSWHYRTLIYLESWAIYLVRNIYAVPFAGQVD
jgi:hypothetical protein